MTKFYLFVMKRYFRAMGLQVLAKGVEFGLSRPFGISRGQKTAAEVLEVVVRDGSDSGRGEGVPYKRYGDSIELALSQLERLPDSFSRADVLDLLPAGSARNALDLALWDLECKKSGLSIWSAAEIGTHRPLSLGYTISLSSTAAMIQDSIDHSSSLLLKVKLGGDDDRAAILGIREAAPNATLIVDVNEGWDPEQLKTMIPVLLECGVELLEQPLPAKLDEQLASIEVPILLCADESFYPDCSIQNLSPAFGCVNVKLDKSGGLTKAMQDMELAREFGLKVMVGCMVSSSLAIAPAFAAAQLADYWDLDGFLSLSEDRSPAMRVEHGEISLPAGLWC